MEKKANSVFEKLSAVNVNEHVEQKEGLSYLSWTWAWATVKSMYPGATYQVRQFEGRPYLNDDALGIMVMTSVTIEGETLEMWLPVMDAKNKAQKTSGYTYKTKYGDKSVEPATMFDVNTAIMRCLVKNIAMFGLGHYIYAGENIPQSEKIEAENKLADAIQDVREADTLERLHEIWNTNTDLQSNSAFKAEVMDRKNKVNKPKTDLLWSD